MKIASKVLQTVENRIRDTFKMKVASKNIDQKRRKAPAGWDSAQMIRQLRQGRG